MGIIAAVRRNTAWDYAALGVSTLLAAIPNFVLAFIMLLIFAVGLGWVDVRLRSEEHTSELQSLMRISYAVFCLKNKKKDKGIYRKKKKVSPSVITHTLY